jgi:N-acetylglucosamine kinase-like BadF-type ATPase
MAKKQFVIGMDGGGTKTTAMLCELRGNILVEQTGGPSNFQIIGVDKAAEVLFDLIERCCREIGCSLDEVRSVSAGLTGAGREGDQERMRNGLIEYARRQREAFRQVTVESDARIALEGAFRGNVGIILISGTGSIAFGKDQAGNVHRAGGWGRVMGDEGSGYSIGRDALNAVTKELDGRGKPTLLTKLTAKQFGLLDQEKIITAIYRDNFDVALLAPLVIEAATSHDVEASRILNKATFELAEHVRALLNKIEKVSRVRQKIPLAFIGSVISSDNVFSNVLRNKIVFSLPQISIVKPEAPPAYGAVLIALRSLRNLHE